MPPGETPIEASYQRFNFDDVFVENADGSLRPKRTVRLNAVTMGPSVSFIPGVSFGGVDIHQYKNRPIAGKLVEDNVLEIFGFYDS